ncbi:MAG: aryl-sulfate sulfotransferase [Candidatus Eisenbacteria bacterium]|uniref:Aryl-sulfate sulfotransferase n=1 Tax=Eiseniibacteriota bacterium TaxID=2212470 RepID=A0A948RY85_UNCEI|nr:aryl-sulfate sulfotransferase [Candidatus Eisenbacteria bacterium]MBU1947124.1 aryl-sulfate sulfotransferase [Candidatus Eisenbacteria bacterium]MBU2691783.1 aryl-sulfate sulfotransferase [Candidatus Eisenbacteria bacterium]
MINRPRFTPATLALAIILFVVLSACEEDNNPTGSPEPEIQAGEFYVDVYDATKACNGTTLFADLHDTTAPRLVEVNMNGEIVWEYDIPDDVKSYHQPGMDVELLANGNILFVLPRYGIYEIDRDGDVAWSHLDSQVSHDADRLPNGNTIYVFGAGDRFGDTQVKEVNPQGEVIWSWQASDHYNNEPYISCDREGWIHTNAATRLQNGNTLLSLRNFSLTIEIEPQGAVVWEFDWKELYPTTNPLGHDPHEPEMQNGNQLLICLQRDAPYQIVELDRNIGQPVWQYHRDHLRTSRDGDRLPNGNTLIVGVLEDTDDSVIFEITNSGEIVWQFKIKDTPATNSPGWFYKAQRICR